MLFPTIYIVPKGWKSPVHHYKEETIEILGYGARIKKDTYNEGFYLMENVLGYEFFYCQEPIDIVVLETYTPPEDPEAFEKKEIPKKWEETMVADPINTFGMLELARASRGRVLVAGLGLGLIIHYLSRNPKVKEITVIEKNPAVIELIGKYIQGYRNIKIEPTDYFLYLAKEILKRLENPEEYLIYDTAIIDIYSWNEDTPIEIKREIENKMFYLYISTKTIAKKVYVWGVRNPEINPACKTKL